MQPILIQRMKGHSIFLFFVIIVIAMMGISSCNQGTAIDSNGKNTAADNGNETGIDSPLAAINQRIKTNPNSHEGYLERAKYYGEKKQYGLAYEDIRRALDVDSTKGDIYLLRGQLQFEQELIKDAYASYQQCLSHEATHEECLLRKSEIDIVLGNYNIAREHLNQVLQQNEFNAEAYYIRGRMYKALKDTNLAASSYKTAIEVDPNYYNAYVEVGLLYANQKSELAKEYYNSAIELRPKSVEALYNKGMFLQETGRKNPQRYREAFACYDSIIKIDSRFSAAYFNKGYIYLEYLNKYDSAAYQFTNAIGVHPRYYQAYYNRGLCYESLNKPNDAEADYRTALSIEPTYTEAALSLERVLRVK
jgi:tetratricopeptide (TPR) repeat protein